MKKICCFFNTPSVYRKSIYSLIDKEFDCDWFFGDYDNKVKRFDTSILKRITFLHVGNAGSRIYWTNGLVNLIANSSYDFYLMFGPTWDLYFWVAIIIKNLFYKNKKIFLWVHGWYGKETKIEKLLKMFMYNSVEGIFCYGDRARDLLIERGLSENKVFAIHNSLNYEEQVKVRRLQNKTDIYRCHFGNNFNNIIFIGRLTKVKQLNLLLESIALLRDKGMILNLILVGDGPMKEELIALTEKLRIETNVWFYGACFDDEENAELVYNADLCVAPGNIGLTAMHAMMFGTPCISHDSFEYQMPEFEAIKKGKTGTFFKRNDACSLATAIEEWFISQKDKREVIREQCYSEIDENWNPYYQISLIKEVLSNAGCRKTTLH